VTVHTIIELIFGLVNCTIHDFAKISFDQIAYMRSRLNRKIINFNEANLAFAQSAQIVLKLSGLIHLNWIGL